MNLYEGMFLLDNDVVRGGWDQAKALVTDTLEKHGAAVRTARRWAERKLAYPIRNRRRATYLLAYFEGEGPTVTDATREMDLKEGILRYLVLSVDRVPAQEESLAAAEAAPDFVIPEPPADDEPDEPPAEEVSGDERESEKGSGRKSEERAKGTAEGDSGSSESSGDRASDDAEPDGSTAKEKATAGAGTSSEAGESSKEDN